MISYYKLNNQRRILVKSLFPPKIWYIVSEKKKRLLGSETGPGDIRILFNRKRVYPGTDHSAWEWLSRMKDSNSRSTRWYLSLQPFHFPARHMAESCNLNADYLPQQECLNILEPVSRFSRGGSDCSVLHHFKIFCSLPNLNIFHAFKGWVFLLQTLFTLLRWKTFISGFPCYLKASSPSIYTGGMNLPIYSTRMAELQSVWHLGLVWSCHAQCTVASCMPRAFWCRHGI